MKQFSILALISIVTLFSCNKDDDYPGKTYPDPNPPSTGLFLNPVFGGLGLRLDSVYTLSNGFKIKFQELKAYFTDIKADGDLIIDAGLFDFRENGGLVFKTFAGTPGTELQFGIGVPSSINHNDPSLFPNSNPLNIAIANDMHWDWSPGYIFFKVEAKVDTIVDGITNCDHNLVYHVGTDDYYTSKTLSGVNWTFSDSNSKHVSLKLDIKNFFENAGNEIDVKTEFTTHSMASQSVLTEKARQNFAASISAQ